MPNLSLVQMDVFSATPLEGNALAVILDGRELTDVEMQALAKETNLSETTFILPRDPATERQRGVRVRIFTVAENSPSLDIRRSARRSSCGDQRVRRRSSSNSTSAQSRCVSRNDRMHRSLER
ncbi:MAG TPA: PhzF family phenazine biosynthesis protein [Terriglobales bacterium]|nr:PhzF family phenazine biosynthesis protein [Terriglobales bacterium]